VGSPGIFDRPRYAGERREMKNHLDPSDRAATHHAVAEIAAQKLDLAIQAGEIGLVARGEVVYDPNVVPESYEPLGDVGTDKARTTRDKAP